MKRLSWCQKFPFLMRVMVPGKRDYIVHTYTVRRPNRSEYSGGVIHKPSTGIHIGRPFWIFRKILLIVLNALRSVPNKAHFSQVLCMPKPCLAYVRHGPACAVVRYVPVKALAQEHSLLDTAALPAKVLKSRPTSGPLVSFFRHV